VKKLEKSIVCHFVGDSYSFFYVNSVLRDFFAWSFRWQIYLQFLEESQRGWNTLGCTDVHLWVIYHLLLISKSVKKLFQKGASKPVERACKAPCPNNHSLPTDFSVKHFSPLFANDSSLSALLRHTFWCSERCNVNCWKAPSNLIIDGTSCLPPICTHGCVVQPKEYSPYVQVACNHIDSPETSLCSIRLCRRIYSSPKIVFGLSLNCRTERNSAVLQSRVRNNNEITNAFSHLTLWFLGCFFCAA